MTKIPFRKMHGAGNDFILIDEFNHILVPEEKKPEFVARICRRNFGIGADGVIFVQHSDKLDAKFSFYNPDGSKAEMCGNGIRCFAKYVYEHTVLQKEKLKAETLAGKIVPELTVKNGIVTEVRVDMGRPEVGFVDKEVKVDGDSYNITSVSMGNPHAVLFYDNVDAVDVTGIGRAIRNFTGEFPSGTNVHFVQKISDKEFKIRTYERGVEGETLACGTGISAAAVSVWTKKLTNSKKILFHARGGDLGIELDIKDGKVDRVFLIGPAEDVFTGEIEL
ncbi:MAG: diaminopimelate epimerase [Candidatus Altiarchaeales archaeon]|nr:diaminopimelate epimerase [Candidatus Altiarchaeales archaeon]